MYRPTLIIPLCFKLYKEAVDLTAEQTARKSSIERHNLEEALGKLLILLGKKLPTTMTKHRKAKTVIEQYKEKGRALSKFQIFLLLL